MIKRTVNNLSNFLIKKANLDKNKKDKIRFGLEIIISSLISLITILVISLISGLTNIVIFVMISSTILKLIAGGIHFKTIGECALISALFYNITAFIAKYSTQLLLEQRKIFFLAASIFILSSLYFRSPAPVENKPAKTPEERKKLKLFSLTIAIIFLIISYFQQNYIGTGLLMGLILHSFTIIPPAYYLHDKYYSIKNAYVNKD